MRLIDAEKFEVISLQGKSEEFVDGVTWVLEQIDNATTVDAIPRERIEQMVAEIKQIHSDWFKEYDSATAYTKISEFIHKYTKEQTDD